MEPSDLFQIVYELVSDKKLNRFRSLIQVESGYISVLITSSNGRYLEMELNLSNKQLVTSLSEIGIRDKNKLRNLLITFFNL